MKNQVTQDIKKYLRILIGFYLVALLIIVLATLHATKVSHRNLADGLAAAARTSLMTRDFRQAVNILTPSLKGSFSSIYFRESNGNYAFSLPSEKQSAQSESSVFFKPIKIDISSSGDESNTESSVGHIVFYFNWLSPVVFAVGLWTVFLTSSVPVFRKLKIQLEKRHLELRKLESAETVSYLAAQVSHDMVSPLSAIRAALHPGSPWNNEKSLLVRSACERLMNIALDLKKQKLHLGGQSDAANPANFVQNQISLSKINLPEILLEGVQEKRMEIASKTNHKICLDLERELGMEIHASRPEFLRVISNLLNNAIEANPRSGQVQLKLFRQDHLAVVEIADDGIGISPQTMQNLGKRPVTEGKSEMEGTGLGLFHAFKCVEAMGGKLSLTSKVDAGTVVQITFALIDAT